MHKPEEIVAKLRQVEVLIAGGKPVAEAARAIAVGEATYRRWRAEYGGLELDQAKRLEELERGNARLRKAVSDLTLEEVVLKEAASGNHRARPAGAAASTMWGRGSASRSASPAGCWASMDRRSGRCRGPPGTRPR